MNSNVVSEITASVIISGLRPSKSPCLTLPFPPRRSRTEEEPPSHRPNFQDFQTLIFHLFHSQRPNASRRPTLACPRRAAPTPTAASAMVRVPARAYLATRATPTTRRRAADESARPTRTAHPRWPASASSASTPARAPAALLHFAAWPTTCPSARAPTASAATPSSRARPSPSPVSRPRRREARQLALPRGVDSVLNAVFPCAAPPRTPVDPCQPSPCGPNSQCRAVNEQAVCSCLVGYIGAPPQCRPECVVSSECPLDRACINQKCADPCPNTCGVRAQCSVRNHNPICACPPGFTGDPFLQCSPQRESRSDLVISY